MTDDIIPQNQPPVKRDEKKPSGTGSNRAPKKNAPTTGPKSTGTTSQAGTRPSSRSSNKKPSSGTPVPESGSDTTSKKAAENSKKPERSKSSGGGRNGHRKGPSAVQPVRNTNSGGSKTSGSPAPQNTESSALSSLQNLIADLKTTSPNQPTPGPTITFGPTQNSTNVPSNLPINAPVFQPGALSYGGIGMDQKHRKAASLGNSTLSGNFNSFTPQFDSTIEEDGGGPYEAGEIPERFPPQQTHQPRSQSQSFVAPRFAALAAQQQEQMDVGPTGRPQLAPGFMFGARKRTPLGPAITEEDVGFQFPQQPPGLPSEFVGHDVPRKAEGGEITGIMAEQVRA